MADIRDEDIDSDLEVDDEVDVKNAPVETDAMLSINSHMFHKNDWKFIEGDKSNSNLYMKLADFGKLSSKQDSELKPLSDEDYLFMRAKMIEKLGSLATKYLPPAAPPVASKKAEKGKGGNKKQSKNTAAKIVKENTEKLLISDVNSMRIGNDVSLSENHKWHEPCSLLMSLLYWGLHVIHALKGKLKIDNKTAVIPMKVAMDCFVSLYRGKEDMKSICPVTLLDDIKVVDELLHKQLTKKYGDDLLALLSVDVPWLINENFYDTVKPKSIQLYEEQQLVLNMIDESLSTNKPVLVGYQVPPSGGKTILSVSIASMLAHKYRSKKLLYICYNTLVRKAVANACAQAAVPFWVASSRQKVAGDDPVSAIRPSNSCLSLTRRAKRERYLYALNTGFKNKESAMDEMYARAESQTVHHCPIIIADLASAIILLDLYPEDFVVYVDEPTAGAERGLHNNKITSLVADICLRLPPQAVLLSATLPDIPTELPTLANNFKSRYGAEASVKMVTSLRLPVGCDALDASGKQVLPHQLAINFDEYKLVVSKMHSDPLMQRFYTPSSVRQLSLTIANACGAESPLPESLQFEHVIPHIGAVKHSFIRHYAQQLLEYVVAESREDIFEVLKSMELNDSSTCIPCTAGNLLKEYCVDGRALAVANTRTVIEDDPKAPLPEPVDQTLDILVRAALEPFGHMPKLSHFVNEYEKKIGHWEAEGRSLHNSKVSKRDNNAVAELQDKIIAHDQNKPTFEWPVKIHGRSAGLSVAASKELADDVSSLLYSGVGYYDPFTNSEVESVAVIKEATEGRLACLFASPFIVYGTNIDLVTVFIGTSYSATATRNALYQLIGRAGRTGKSHKAKVLFQDNDSLRKAMIPSVENIEATIIEHHLHHSAHNK